jgi:amino acid transporter
MNWRSLLTNKRASDEAFSESEGIMSVLRYVAPAISTLFGLYCIIWGLIASSYPTSQRIGAAFLGVLFLLLAVVYLRVILPREREEVVRSDQVR